MSLEETLKKYRINPSEYEKIKEILGREPQGVEWAIFSALWSEHCSYKSSKVHLKKLFSKSDRVLQSFGENAGIVDLGLGEKVAFKMESHNHPSFIEPYQGAATGVGGILRDIFTMGARPIALANALYFGEPKAERMSELVDGVVRGIGGYGNCVGVPTLTGSTYFDPSYNGNILVNAMAVGLFQEGDPICLSGAQGVGNAIVYVGAKTGRDGVHGASMASESFDADSESKRPTVQIGDPFYEKLLIESCLEVMKKNLVVAIQDMGAAGLTSSSFEMAEKGGVGFLMHLDKIPLRDESMSPEDILLSESQERMLLICEPEKLQDLQKVFHRWGLDAVSIGEVTEDPQVHLVWHGETLTRIHPEQVVGQAPQYERPFDKARGQGFARVQPKPRTTQDKVTSLPQYLSDIRLGSKEWVYRQYDQRVGASTCLDASSPVGAVVLPSGRALGVALGCRPHIMAQNPEFGGQDAILYPSLQLASLGFEPLAVTDCLNFGNPEKVEVMTDFVVALKGMNQACENMKTPIISGNVSFYNETFDQGVIPTPSTGLVGLRPHLDDLPSSEFIKPGQPIYTLNIAEGWSSGLKANDFSIEKELSFADSLSEVCDRIAKLAQLCRTAPISVCRAVGQSGLGGTLAKMTFKNNLGLKIHTEQAPFLIPLYQVILSLDPEGVSTVLSQFSEKGFHLEKVGEVTDSAEIVWQGQHLETKLVKEAHLGAWAKAFPELS